MGKNEGLCPVFNHMDMNQCCGCEGCTNVCPTQALSMEENAEGFIYPYLEKEKCVNCDMCVRICPMLNAQQRDNPLEKYYGFSHTDEEILIGSASGGVFTFIHDNFIKKYPNGFVCGAIYTDDCKRIIHVVSNKYEDFLKMRGSKYFQSYKGDIYRKVQELLKDDCPVLFTGSPCEVDALYRYLGKDYEKLWTIDYICKGSSTPRMLREYVEHLNKRYNSKANYISMRYKWSTIDNWIPQFVKVEFENGKSFLHEFYNTELGICFQIVQRMNCRNCPYREKLHPADFTMGDFHEHNPKDSVFNHMGTSVVIINTEKSNRLWQNWDKSDIKFREITKEEVYRKNRNPVNSRASILRNYMRSMDFITAVRSTIGLKEKIKMVMPVMPLRKITAWRREHKT